MDIKQLVENARFVWEEKGFYKQEGILLFSDETKEIAEAVLHALDGCNFYTAATILEACKMALQQAPILLEKEGEPDA